MNPIEAEERIKRLEKTINELSEKVLQLGKLNTYNSMLLVGFNKRIKDMEEKVEGINNDK